MSAVTIIGTSKTLSLPPNIKVCQPPSPPAIEGVSIFLAGSIELGVAEDWQTVITQQLASRLGSTSPSAPHITILNPRRDADKWDGGLDASSPSFREQVHWELDALDAADVICLYFSPGTKSPISLLELGLYAKTGKLVVCCPAGFWRRGNVILVCERVGAELLEGTDGNGGNVRELGEAVLKRVEQVIGERAAEVEARI